MISFGLHKCIPYTLAFALLPLQGNPPKRAYGSAEVYPIVILHDLIISNVALQKASPNAKTIAQQLPILKELIQHYLLRFHALKYYQKLPTPKKEALQRYINQKYSAQIKKGIPPPQRQALKAHIAHQVKIYFFLENEVFPHSATTTPSLQKTLHPLPEMPHQYQCLVLSYRLAKNENPQDVIDLLYQPLQKAITLLAKAKITPAKIHALAQKKNFPKSKALQIAYLTDGPKNIHLKHKQLPSQVAKHFAVPLAKWNQGLCSTPFLSTNEKGEQILQMYCLSQMIPPHKPSPAQDYQFLLDLYLQKEREKKLQAWLHAHKDEIEIEEEDYQEVLDLF